MRKRSELVTVHACVSLYIAARRAGGQFYSIGEELFTTLVVYIAGTLLSAFTSSP
jgi:hypothetical protein